MIVELELIRDFRLRVRLLAVVSRYIQSGSEARAARLGRRIRHGIRFLSADDARKCLSGEFPDDLLAQHELGSSFLHYWTLAQRG